MEGFFNKYTYPEEVSQKISNFLQTEDFFSLTDSDLIQLLSDDIPTLARFSTDLTKEKILRNSFLNDGPTNHATRLCNIQQVEESGTNPSSTSFEFESITSNVPETTGNEDDVIEEEKLFEIEEIDLKELDDNESETFHNELPDSFDYVKNSLFYAINEDLNGQIALGVYKNEKCLNERALRDVILKILLSEDPITYSITTQRFLEVSVQLKELFPTINIKNWYERHHKDALGNEVRASGNLYYGYKRKRAELGRAGMLPKVPRVSNSARIICENNDSSLECLTSCDRTKYDLVEVSSRWKSSLQERLHILIQNKNKKKIIKYEAYLNTFNCLKHPLALDLLKIDFRLIVTGLFDDGKISKSTLENIDSLFISNWPAVAKKIVTCSKRVRVTEVKQCREKYASLITSGTYDLLALFLLPLSISVTKVVKSKLLGNVTIKKSEIASHFIIHLENASEIEACKTTFSKRLHELDLDVHPYVVFCGPLENLTKTYLIIRNENYEYKNPLDAVQDCFKVCTALHTWSSISDYVWSFIQQTVYALNPNVSPAFVTKDYTHVRKFIETIEEKEEKNKKK